MHKVGCLTICLQRLSFIFHCWWNGIFSTLTLYLGGNALGHIILSMDMKESYSYLQYSCVNFIVSFNLWTSCIYRIFCFCNGEVGGSFLFTTMNRFLIQLFGLAFFCTVICCRFRGSNYWVWTICWRCRNYWRTYSSTSRYFRLHTLIESTPFEFPWLRFSGFNISKLWESAEFLGFLGDTSGCVMNSRKNCQVRKIKDFNRD